MKPQDPVGAHTLRVLLVDDIPEVVEALALILEMYDGIEIAGTANDAEGALAAAEDDTLDVIVMDINMPGQDGISAAAAILARDRRPAIVMHSAYTDQTLVDEAYASGVSSFVEKGAPSRQLVAAIRAAAEASHRRPES